MSRALVLSIDKVVQVYHRGGRFASGVMLRLPIVAPHVRHFENGLTLLKSTSPLAQASNFPLVKICTHRRASGDRVGSSGQNLCPRLLQLVYVANGLFAILSSASVVLNRLLTCLVRYIHQLFICLVRYTSRLLNFFLVFNCIVALVLRDCCFEWRMDWV